ncbi:MAG: cysteine--tRNA ligase [bacterium]
MDNNTTENSSDIYLFNTLGKSKQKFSPITPNKVGMYHCGPTVYDYPHIGNLRAYVFADTLRRVFEYNGYEVNQVINITDIGHLSSDSDEGEDKMTKAILREGKTMTLASMREIADYYYHSFRDAIKDLNILSASTYPFASDHIKEDVDMINILLDKDVAYKTSKGIYFDTSKKADYGKLGQTAGDESRIGEDSEKRNYKDFAIWKFDDKLGYDTTFGKGFPGWHIECSAMSAKYLGDSFDIHTGGVDHIPVHHNNEIAQSECAHGGAPLANFWLHNAFLIFEGGKMSKSAGTFITIDTLKEKGILPLAYRYWLLTARYSTAINYSHTALEDANRAYSKLIDSTASLIADAGKYLDGESDTFKEYKNNFLKFVNDDLDTPKALALVWSLLKDVEIENNEKLQLIEQFDNVLGLNIIQSAKDKVQATESVIEDLTEEVKALIEEREKARKEKNWAEADLIRMKINDLGYKVEDTGNDTKPKISII